MTRLEIFFDNLALQHRWVIHAFFWLFVLALYSLFFSARTASYWQTFFFVSLLLPITMGSTYFLNYYLVPAYLLKERHGLFLLYLMYTLLAALFLEMWIVVMTFILVAELDIRAMNPSSINIPFLIAALLMIVFLGGAIKLLSHWRQSREDNERLLREKVEAELSFLKIQLKPHFLFNTLNNLYFLTSEKSEKAPRAVLALSELLDYILNETKSTFVPLGKEIQLIRNYIELERLRYEDRVEIDVQIKGDPAAFTIAPMLLLTLVENAFKHGGGKTVGQHWIRLEIECAQERIRIGVSNSCVPLETPAGHGIGLKNFKDQLSLLYSSRHALSIDRQSEVFTVNLELTV